MYDVIIIGGGPAGVTAGIYTARKNLKTLLITKELGGQMIWSADIENYTGFSLIDGASLTQKFREHLLSLKENLELLENKEVIALEKNFTSFSVTEKTGKQFFGKTIIIASGKRPKHLGIPGEMEFFGHGVATCATCDAPLYKNKDVAVIGGGNSALEALLALSRVARRVYSINTSSDFSGEEIVKEKVGRLAEIQFFKNTQALEILGDPSVTGLKIKSAGKEQVLEVAGVFVEIGYEPNNEFDQLTLKNSKGEIKVDANLQTSIPGIFAAGDINDAWGEQIVIAAGEGSKAALAAADHLNKLKI
jgi:alkyl hydroperoxide reductase subunit F